MRLKFTFPITFRHYGRVDCIGWMSPDDLYSIGEDHIIYKYNGAQNELSKIGELEQDLYALDMHWLPRCTTSLGSSGIVHMVNSGSGGKQAIGSDLFLLATNDGMNSLDYLLKTTHISYFVGKFFFVNKIGRMEKAVEAHQGAIICVRWSSDGSQIATGYFPFKIYFISQIRVLGGEDGQVRIWGRSGILRSNLVQSVTSIFSLCWSPDNNSILYCVGKHLVIKPLLSNSKQNTWKAHEQVVLKCDWNAINNLIISGSEDCRYKIWDALGRLLYTSQAYEYPITSLAWAPDGQNFAVGSYNTIRLCDSWCHSVERFNDGSIFSVSWSSDSTQLACGCGTGRIGIGHIIERGMSWRHFEFILTDSKMITVNNYETELSDRIELRDRLVKMSVGFGFLIVLTTNQGLIYNCKQLGHPVLFDLRDIFMNLIVQTEKYFLLSDGMNVSVYLYEGRFVSTLKLISPRPNSIHINTISVSHDTIAIRDSTNMKSVMFFDINGKPMGDGKLTSHKHDITYLTLDQTSSTHERKLAFIDKFQDLFVMCIHTSGQHRQSNYQKLRKLCTNVSSFRWNEKNGMLACIADGKLTIWLYPNVVFIDPSLLNKTVYRIESNDFGKNPSIVNFLGCQITIRKSTGALIQCAIPIYYELCLDLLAANRGDEALQLCQYISDDSIYSLIAVRSLYNRDLDSAENAFAQLSNTEMILFLQHLRLVTSKDECEAELVLLTGGDVQQAAEYYFRGNKPLHAIMLYINEHNWDRAIDLTQRYPQYLDVVVGFRQRYLNEYGNRRKETISKYLQAMKTVDIDWNRINAKLRKDLDEDNVLRIIN
ncbi:unnamed protein product [Adineta ricciae]|uniref:Intraflagellar transport protein 80-like protein n=1 Tax=Adineta ricciae TaxID=249248 RepID=A0A813PBZ3_ADIRI|nr:unnamed protein product [Adineta ricciae]